MYEATKQAVVGLSLRYFHIVVCSAFLALRLAFGRDPNGRKGQEWEAGEPWQYRLANGDLFLLQS